MTEQPGKPEDEAGTEAAKPLRGPVSPGPKEAFAAKYFQASGICILAWWVFVSVLGTLAQAGVMNANSYVMTGILGIAALSGVVIGFRRFGLGLKHAVPVLLVVAVFGLLAVFAS